MAAGEVLMVTGRVRLDWSDPIHWEHDVLADCRVCHSPTQSRDAQERPAHQSCVETELAAERVGQRSARVIDERFRTPAQQLHQARTEVAR
jgi:hypothetical protein